MSEAGAARNVMKDTECFCDDEQESNSLVQKREQLTKVNSIFFRMWPD